MGQRYEGTWEEIAKHADELRGRQIIVTMFEPPPPLTPTEEEASVADFERLMAEIDDQPFTKAPPPAKPDDYGDSLIAKYRKQGLDL